MKTKTVKVMTPYQEEYQHFVYEWNKMHKISKAPSYTSWKKFYKFN